MRLRIASFVCLLILAAGPAWGEVPPQETSRWLIGIGVGVTQPLGGFRRGVDPSVPIEVVLTRQLDPARRFGLRAAFLVDNYAQLERDLAGPGGTIRVTTSNLLRSITLGASWRLGGGTLQGLLHAGAGPTYFSAETTFGSTASPDRQQDFRTTVTGIEAGASLLWRLRRDPPRVAVLLDVKHLHNGPARYVTRAGLDASGGGLVITPTEGDANLMVYQAGVVVGVEALWGAVMGD